MADDDHIEEWRQIPGRASGYSASSLGRIRRDAGAMGAKVGRILRQHGGRKYLTVGMSSASSRFRGDVHRFVAAAFLGVCPPGLEVDHINGHRRDNRASNLRYVTRRANVLNAVALGLCPLGEQRVNHKLSAKEVLGMRAAAASGESFGSLGRRYRVAATTAKRVVRFETWRHITQDTGAAPGL